ncbi:MAG: sigma-70 family RNA polymerase sigma factor [Bacteriovoracaceae bacterium]|jgi:RNA polymerase sigma-70 factor (ECF subfamily)|nr:sigma-70 family RNA polymerase sigma factor [Bacteriovoracaceae bacterium]
MGNPFSHLEDEKLMELYKNGENMAFEVIYLRHKNRVYSYLDKRLSDKNAIEDIFQSIFVKFHKSRHLYDNKHPLLKWLYVICKSELLDAYKKNKVKFVQLTDDKLPTDSTQTNDKINLDDIESLSLKEKKALELRYYSDEDFAQMAKTLKTSEANSRKLVSRGIKKLKIKLLGETK